jgi:hypothetical protein
MKHIAFPLVAMFLTACAAIETYSWGEWVSPDIVGTNTEAFSILDWSNHPGTITSIDGATDVKTGFKRARLLPGRHIISYAVWIDDITTGEIAWGSRPDWRLRW